LSKEKPIHKAIANTYNPFIPGLSGREDNAVALLTKVGIKLRDEKGKWRTFAALSDDEKDRLLAGIAEWVLKEPAPEAITSLLTTIFEFPGEEDELATAQSVSELINATARMGASHVGLRLAMMPDRHALEQAKGLVEKRREQLAHVFQAIEREARAKRLRATLFIDGRGLIDERLASSVATILSTSPANKGLYVVVVSTPRNGAVKVSARAAKLGLPNPRNLGLVLSELASKHGGFGGGHSVAAGARIPENEVEAFVAELDNTLREGDDNQSEDNTRF
jgi:RecJ-like exonuclease